MAILAAAPAISSAESLPIVNPGFEDGVMDEENYEGTTPDWQTGRYNVNNPGVWIDLGGDAYIYRPTTDEYTDPGVVPEGEKVAFVDGIAGFDNGIRQILTRNLAPNHVYTLSVAIGNPALYNVPPPAPDYRIELLAGGVLLASRSGSPPEDDSAFDIVTITYSSGQAPAQIGQPLEIRLIAIEDPRNDDYGVDYDDVRLTAEPVLDLRITSNGTDFDFQWNSHPDKVYDLLTSTDLGIPVAAWEPYGDGDNVYENIPANGGVITLIAVPSADPRRFFAVRARTAPAMSFADMEETGDGFSTSDGP